MTDKSQPDYQEKFFAKHKHYDMMGPRVTKEQALQHALNQINRAFGK